MNEQLKKLTVLESTNHHLDYKALQVYDKPIGEEFLKLREYVEQFIVFDSMKDPEIIFEVLTWVSQQWKHDGYNDPGMTTTSLEILKRAHEGEQFRCVEYGRVASDILSSYGFTGRHIGIRTENVDYGGAGMGHVATEVWSNGLGKWIFIDPQFAAYFEYHGEPLNFHDMYGFWTRKEFDVLDLIVNEAVVSQSGKDEKTYKANYINFITNYFGYVQTKFTSPHFEYSVSLKLDGTREAMTFQGMPEENISYTSNVEELYFKLNQSLMTFTYHEKVDFMKVIKENNITTAESYLENMHKFAAEPNLNVICHHNTPRFDFFEYSHDKENWQKVEDKSFDWNITEGVHEAHVRSVNKQGLRGMINSLKVEYR